MSRFQQLLILCCLIAFGSNVQAQDIHFTQYNMSPMTLNPANTGAFQGTARIGGIYRDQWSSIIGGNRFSTPSFWVDAPIFRGFRSQDWVGAGVMLFQDNAGELSLKHTAFKLGASYHLALDKKQNNVLTLGIHYGGEQRSLDRESANFADAFDAPTGGFNSGTSADYARLAMADGKYTDFDAGVLFSSKLNKTTDIKIGFSMFHLTEPAGSVLSAGGGTGGANGDNQKIGRRSIVHGQFNTQLNDKLTLSPSFLFQTMRGADEIVVQGLAGYLFNEEKKVTLNFGLGYRLSDAIQVLAGAKIKDLTVGLAYDINTSDLSSVTNYRGGFELAANYIIRIYKPTVVVPKALCPRY